MTVFDSGPCRWCGEPEENHGARYMALVGEHRWAPMRPAGTPRIVDHPQGGVTQEWTDTPSDRLPPRPLPPVPDDGYPPDARDLPVQLEQSAGRITEIAHGTLAVFGRILNATKRSST